MDPTEGKQEGLFVASKRNPQARGRSEAEKLCISFTAPQPAPARTAVLGPNSLSTTFTSVDT